ncbi:hypothetical protein D1164_10380 [Mariniphaga sediminis]|uniref:Uncharacterized protein n=2 Tax=Mariniphaga sediminis TaxID=1628158 RepID=A0A399D3K4_9BACT|nr:hypothetical protein D1164_10380 [Mariniphaga sediminis]
MIGPCIAKGTDPDNQEYLVFGGDLFLGESVEVKSYHKNKNLFIVAPLNYSNTKIFEKHFDKDGLIDFKKLKEVKLKSTPFHRIYEIDGYWVFPDKKIKKHIEYLYQNGLENYSKIKISKSYNSVTSRIPVYSVNYQTILDRIIKDGDSISSWFICEREKNFDKGVYADLYVLGNLNEANIQIQLWQIIGQGEEILYAHLLLDKESKNINHFDLATHFVHPFDIPKLIYDKKRIELIAKTKWLRIDNGISDNQAFDLIKLFFPIDYLVDEFNENPVPNNL